MTSKALSTGAQPGSVWSQTLYPSSSKSRSTGSPMSSGMPVMSGSPPSGTGNDIWVPRPFSRLTIQMASGFAPGNLAAISTPVRAQYPGPGSVGRPYVELRMPAPLRLSALGATGVRPAAARTRARRAAAQAAARVFSSRVMVMGPLLPKRAEYTIGGLIVQCLGQAAIPVYGILMELEGERHTDENFVWPIRNGTHRGGRPAL